MASHTSFVESAEIATRFFKGQQNSTMRFRERGKFKKCQIHQVCRHSSCTKQKDQPHTQKQTAKIV